MEIYRGYALGAATSGVDIFYYGELVGWSPSFAGARTVVDGFLWAP